jgi:hypothetical protein
MRQGFVYKREMVLGAWSIVFLLLAFCSKRIWPETWPLLPVLAIGAIIALNQQLVTGMFLVPHHYHWYFIQPLASIVFLIFIFSLSRFFSARLRTISSALLLIFVVGFGFLQQLRIYNGHADIWGQRQRFAPVFSSLSSVSQRGEVLYASQHGALFRDLIAVYTPWNVYTAGNANNFLTSGERAEHSFFFDLWLDDFTPDDAEKHFPSDLRSLVSERMYGIFYRESLGQYTAIPDDIVQRYAHDYREYYNLSLTEKIGLHPLHSIIFTPSDVRTAGWNELFSASVPMFETDGYFMRNIR